MILVPLPSYRLVQGFGQHPEIYKQFGHRGHNGYDFAPVVPGQRGVVVYAPHEGYVRLFDEGDSGYGRYVEILSLPAKKDGTRHKSDLAHFERFLVRDGQYVAMNDPVGIMGSTGFSTGIHCHWTYKKADRNGKTLDKGNGYAGALPIGPYARQWVEKTLT